MLHRFMAMPVRMWFGYYPIMTVLMVIVMDMTVFVSQGLMGVLMVMTFREMQPQARAHQYPGKNQRDGYGMAEQDHCQ